MDALTTDVIGGLTVVLIVAALFSRLALRLGQPAIIGQIVAGILLGPSVLGCLPGRLDGHLFPTAGIPALNALAQVAVSLFMFVVGYELDLGALRGRRRAPGLVAASALMVPMALGCGLVLLFHRGFGSLAQHPVNAVFVLYMGLAVSVTALPVLAAIVRERDLANTAAGATATAAAGMMDVTAWLVLAVVLATNSPGTGRPWPETVALFLCFLVVMRWAVRPALRLWMRNSDAQFPKLVVAAGLCLGGAWATSALGLHPVFGAFVAGLIMPGEGGDGGPDAEVLRPLEQTGGLLLPLFFAVTGLSLDIGSMTGAAFAALGAILLVAIAGKLLSAYAGARLGGLAKNDAMVVAVLVDTRGLTELIALNIGLHAKLISPRLYAALVLMALITTLLTAPLLGVVKGGFRRRGAPVEPSAVRAERVP